MGGKNPGKGNCGIAFVEFVESEMMCKALSDLISSYSLANAQLELALVAEEDKKSDTTVRSFMLSSIQALGAAHMSLESFRTHLWRNLKEISVVKPGTIPCDSFNYDGFGIFVVDHDQILDKDAYRKVKELLIDGGFAGFFRHVIRKIQDVEDALARTEDTFNAALHCIGQPGGISLASHDNRLHIRQDYMRTFSKLTRLSLEFVCFSLISTEMHLQLCNLPSIIIEKSQAS